MAKTILFFDHTGRLGGGEIALLNLVAALDINRFTPVVVLGEDGSLGDRLRKAGVETVIMPLDPRVGETRKEALGISAVMQLRKLYILLCYAWKLSRFIKRRKVVLLHTNSLKADIIGSISAKLSRVPVIWHVRDRIDVDYLPPAAVNVFRWLCRILPDFVIANSAATLSTLPAQPHNRQRVVHDGVAPMTTAKISESAQSSRIVGLVGRISPWKGQHIFVQAAHHIRQHFPKARFAIIGSALFGEDAYEYEVRVLVKKLGMENEMEFLGFREDVQMEIQKLEILVHASTIAEPFGQVVAEAMIQGKPVVATNGGGVAEIMQHNRTGLLVPMGDARKMTEAILWLLNNPEKGREMGRAGSERIRKHFSIEQVARKVEHIYEELLESATSHE